MKATKNIGLVINSLSELKIDCYPNADFSGIYGHKKTTYPACVKGITFYVIIVANYSVLYESILKSETSILTMEEEIITTDCSCKELFEFWKYMG